MADTNDAGIAVILSKLENMEKNFSMRFDRIEERQKENESQINTMRVEGGKHEEKINALQANCAGLTQRVNAWNGMNSLGVIAAGIIALFSK